MTHIVINIPNARVLSSSGAGANGRQGHFAKAREVEAHRTGANGSVIAALQARFGFGARLIWERKGRMRFAIVSGGVLQTRSVLLDRVHPAGKAIRDGDNLRTACKPLRDGIADALGVDDADREHGGSIDWQYGQIVGPWGVRITIR